MILDVHQLDSGSYRETPRLAIRCALCDLELGQDYGDGFGLGGRRAVQHLMTAHGLDRLRADGLVFGALGQAFQAGRRGRFACPVCFGRGVVGVGRARQFRRLPVVEDTRWWEQVCPACGGSGRRDDFVMGQRRPTSPEQRRAGE